MTDFSNAAQQAVYNRLTAQLPTRNIYDGVANWPDGAPLDKMPYIKMGEDTCEPFDTDDTLGARLTITLHVWSRYRGSKECKQILGEIYTALHRQAANLSSSGYRFVDCLYEFSTVIDEADGVTRHGVCRYRLWIEKE